MTHKRNQLKKITLRKIVKAIRKTARKGAKLIKVKCR